MPEGRQIIIGGNGFLGRELTRQLAARGDREIVVVDLHDALTPELRPLADKIVYVRADMTKRDELERIETRPGDTIQSLASRLITPNEPRVGREDYFRSCIVDGAATVLAWMEARGHDRLVFWSTDMVYGPAETTPRPEDHPRKPFGPYGRAKAEAEDLIFEARKGGLQCSIIRPRLIIGPGRLGILSILFALVDRNLPVPLIGNGGNRFQFVAVADCAKASVLAADHGCPNGEFNLGSANPPTTYALLSDLIARVGSKSILLKTNGALVKTVLRVLNALTISPLDPEQYEIADLDITQSIAAAQTILGWQPDFSDADMLYAAYRSYRDPSLAG